ncbi:hypothetical protein SAMN05444161_9023 [Rhizobiales bacterium GAS191]|nr:hypothetical protein SAMN05519104_8040 [Rhizobiales bacterium GAS188]SEF14709.1 hypothetical protein SAMN05444161_9023 [Rhizobiales bacterium GAS191]
MRTKLGAIVAFVSSATIAYPTSQAEAMGWFGSLFGSSGTDPPKVTIENAKASRDSAGLPVITLNYTVKYPSDLYAQTLSGVPTLTCSLVQKQLTQDRTLPGAPINITGTSAAPQKGQLIIKVSDSDKSIGGEFSVTCTLASDRVLGTSNTVSVDVPKPPNPVDTWGVWAVFWEWSVTSVVFEGELSGNYTNWNFEGKGALNGVPAIVACDGHAGDVPNVEAGGGGTMHCIATFTPKPDATGKTAPQFTWEVNGQGRINYDGKWFTGGGPGSTTANGKTTPANSDALILNKKG